MRIYRMILIGALLSLQLNALLSNNIKANPEILYLSPVPDSKYNTKETNIIIRFKDDLNFGTVSEQYFRIQGSISGEHFFDVIRTDEHNTIILKPVIPFIAGEDVKITMLKGVLSSDGRKLKPCNFKFIVSSFNSRRVNENSIPLSDELRNLNNQDIFNGIPHVVQNESLPADFPSITILTRDKPSDGYIFLCNFARFSPGGNTPYLMVIDNNGRPLMYKNMYSSCLDFKVQNNNTFTFFNGNKQKFYSMKPTFQIIDSFCCGNGYITDTHELLLLPDNKAYMMSYDTQTVDMSQIIQGGDSEARVVGLVIQEIDQNKNVIFQWRSWDYFQITDALHENLISHNVDYVHGNAIDLDYDGNVLISSRHLDEITKINRQTGNVIWRWGGKNNQFTFLGTDTSRFYYQHNIRLLPNGNYTLFDNGNFHTPPYSRAVEYKLDQVNKTATLMWQYRNSPDVFAFAMGNVQRLSDGNTVIGWGSANPTMTEVSSNGTKAFEMTFAPTVVSYRAFKFTWDGAPPQIPASLMLAQNYPNPFNPLTTIRYAIPENSFVTLKVYDILGRVVKTLVSEQQEAGNYMAEFNAQDLSSGVYFYKIVAGNYSESKKLVFVK